MLHYPQEFPADAARVIVTNWRQSKIASERAATAEAAWNLVGYGLKASLGSGPDTANGNIAMAGNPGEYLQGDVPDDEEMISKLESWEALPPDNKLMGGLPLDNKTMIKWAMNLAIRIITGLV